MSDFQKPFIYGSFKRAMETIMESEVAATANYPQSQFKKPYLAEDYPKMEWEFSGPGEQPWKPKYGPFQRPDCTVMGDAIGGGAVSPCEPGINCGVWVFSCAHRIKKFSAVQNFGWIQSVQYFKDDTVRVTVCWDESGKTGGKRVGPEAYTSNGQSVVSTVDLTCVGPGNECASCQECQNGGKVPTITYTTQQMNVNDSQSLSATGGGGGPYRWTVQSGGGTLSLSVTTSGQNTVYKAPSSNANCNNNPTIRVTDFCGFYKELKIAVNGDTSGGWAVWKNAFKGFTGEPGNVWVGEKYGCTSNFQANVGQCSTCGNPGICVQCPGCVDTCQAAGCCVFKQNYYPGGTGGLCQYLTGDVRTILMKANGCCPAMLL